MVILAMAEQLHASPFNVIGLGIKGGGRGKKKYAQRLEKKVARVFELREQGMSFDDISRECKTTPNAVRLILHDPNLIRNRLTEYNERLRSTVPIALRVVRETLESTAPTMAGERARMAQWVLEMTKTVGKDAPVNIFLNATHANVNINRDMVEAAKMAAGQLRAAPPDAIDVVPEPVVEPVIETKPEEENSNGDTSSGANGPNGESTGNDDSMRPDSTPSNDPVQGG